MTKKVFLTGITLVAAFSLLDVPTVMSESPHLADGSSVSLTEQSPSNNDEDLGSFSVGFFGRIQGNLERTVPFEAYPGEEFTFDMKLWNSDQREYSNEYALILDFPNEDNFTLDEGSITLGGEESIIIDYTRYVPEGLEIYGRYTLRLLIDDRLADFFQFDLHSRSQMEVRWDDGVLANAWAFYELCNAWAIRGCLPDGSILDSVGVYILSEGDIYWPWPDDIHQDILLQVFDNDGGSGMPGTLLWSEVTRVTMGTSHAVAYPGIPISSAFYIANDQLTDYPDCEGQGVDEMVNHPDQMFKRLDNVWENVGELYGGDFMIWGVGHVGNNPITLGNPPLE